jgi:hypothetical protein
MKILKPADRSLLYDTGFYPYDSTLLQYLPAPITTVAMPLQYAFGVDWTDGSLKHGFPASEEIVGATELVLNPLAGAMGMYEVFEAYEAALLPYYAARTAGSQLSCFLDPDSIRVRVDIGSNGTIDRTLSQVSRIPRAHLDEYQVGLDLPDNASSYMLKYGLLRLPEFLAGGVSPTACTFYVDFRWRNNGVIPAGGAIINERPDLISAYYRSASVIDIAVTVTRADPAANVNKRTSQTAHLTRRVKLHNLLRQVRHED